MKRRLIPVLLALMAFAAQAEDGAKNPESVGSEIEGTSTGPVDKAKPEAAQPASSDSKSEKPADTTASALPKVDLTPQLLYQIILSEMAGARGEAEVATESYLDAARKTGDPRLAKRAMEVALAGGNHAAALAAARVWHELDPRAAQPAKMIAALLAATGKYDELATYLASQLSAAGPDVGNQLTQVSRLLARSPDKQAALKVVNTVTEPYLGLAEAHYARAQAAHAVSAESKQAIAELDRALNLRPDWEQAALVRAQLTQDNAATVAFLGKFVAANPKATDARIAYARALVTQKQYPEARQEFKQLLASDSESGDLTFAVAVLSLQLNDLDDAELQFKRLIDKGHAEIDSARLYLGQIAEERKQWDAALAWYDQVGPGKQYLPARVRAANMLASEKKIPEARRVLQEATAASTSERGQLIIVEAHLMRDNGDPNEALKILNSGLERLPDQTELLYESAMTAEKVGERDLAEKRLRRLIEVKPDYAHAYNALGYSLVERNERLEEAQELIEKALSLSPDDPFIMDSKGWVLFRRGDVDGAAQVLKKAYELRQDPEIAAHLGEVLWTLGRKDEARKTWQEADKAAPGNELLTGTMKRFLN